AAAAIDRSFSEVPREDHQEDAGSEQPEQQPPLDLDMLAQQVYGIVKRRLTSERRRLG
ncbi:MAG: hypothetical protein H7Z42_14640, partial [Roseiflexaceae bacterium]|nr:hypothetical protein [Roseiflexaceae bacterium]